MIRHGRFCASGIVLPHCWQLATGNWQLATGNWTLVFFPLN
jgi:hypothetical protein